jgi:hypothetical protein
MSPVRNNAPVVRLKWTDRDLIVLAADQGGALIHRPAISMHKIPSSPHAELAGVARDRSRFPLEPPVILGRTTEG